MAIVVTLAMENLRGLFANEKHTSSRKVVEVEWIDAQSSLETWTMEELDEVEPLQTFSVGYLLFEKKDFIVLGFMDFANGLIKHHQCIPRGMIKNIKVLRDRKNK